MLRIPSKMLAIKNVEKVLNIIKNEMFDQSLVKTIKCLTKVWSKHLKQSNVWPKSSKHLKQSTLKTYVKDPEQKARNQKYYQNVSPNIYLCQEINFNLHCSKHYVVFLCFKIDYWFVFIIIPRVLKSFEREKYIL
jgi:GTP cyclohydrolase I